MAPTATKWTCPDCGREFGAVGRSHMCRPGLTLDEFLDGALPVARPIVERIVAHLRIIDQDGTLIVDPVESAVLLKSGSTFALLRPMKRWVAVEFSLRRRLGSARLSRKVIAYGAKFHHVVNVDDPADVDHELLAWLAEAFVGEPMGGDIDGTWDGSGDGMVPDDVDVDLN